MTRFAIEGLKHLFQIGTVLQSSRWLACAMTRGLSPNRSPKRVLEVGPGTGAITRALLPSLGRGDELALVEINPLFCRHLERRVLGRFRAAQPGLRVDLRCDSITSAPLEGRFDFVICSVPFRTFDPPEARAVLGRLDDLVADSGQVTIMQYAGVRQVKGLFVSRRRRRELRRIDAMLRRWQRRRQGTREYVALNLPPSWVLRSNKRRRHAVAPVSSSRSLEAVAGPTGSHPTPRT